MSFYVRNRELSWRRRETFLGRKGTVRLRTLIHSWHTCCAVRLRVCFLWGQECSKTFILNIPVQSCVEFWPLELGKEKKQRASKSEKKQNYTYRSIIISIENINGDTYLFNGLEDSLVLRYGFLKTILQVCNITPFKMPAGCSLEMWNDSSRNE